MNRATVVSRAARLRRRSGEYDPTKRLPRIPYADAVAIVVADDARRALSHQAAQLGVLVRVLRRYAPTAARTYEERAAQRSATWRAAHPDYHRAYRLRLKCPPDYDLTTWSEIVDALQARCLACREPASRVARLPDGTPVPACIVHEGQIL
jgi:hypothetical protein